MEYTSPRDFIKSMETNGKIILHDYQSVLELIKAFKVKVERKGDDYSGIYWKVKLK